MAYQPEILIWRSGYRRVLCIYTRSFPDVTGRDRRDIIPLQHSCRGARGVDQQPGDYAPNVLFLLLGWCAYT